MYMLNLCKFYRYFIYRLYHLNNRDQVFRVLFFLYTIHLFHFVTYEFLILRLLSINFYVPQKAVLYVFLLIFFAIHYVLFYNKEKWEEYFKEFENEPKEERKKGTIKVWGYFIGSILIPIFIIILVSELFPQ